MEKTLGIELTVRSLEIEANHEACLSAITDKSCRDANIILLALMVMSSILAAVSLLHSHDDTPRVLAQNGIPIALDAVGLVIIRATRNLHRRIRLPIALAAVASAICGVMIGSLF